MFRCFSIRWLFGIAIALLVLIWIGVLYWALSHNAIPHIFSLDINKNIFSHQASLIEYRSAYNLIYQPNQISEVQPISLFKLGDLLTSWNPDDVSYKKWLESVAHPNKGHNIPRFDFTDIKQKELALKYRNNEIPFIIYNIPELNNAIINTFITSKLNENIGTTKQLSVEKIHTNNYLYYHSKQSKIVKKRYPDWQPPQEDILMTYSEFLDEVYRADMRSDFVNSSLPLYYYTISATEVRATIHTHYYASRAPLLIFIDNHITVAILTITTIRIYIQILILTLLQPCFTTTRASGRSGSGRRSPSSVPSRTSLWWMSTTTKVSSISLLIYTMHYITCNTTTTVIYRHYY